MSKVIDLEVLCNFKERQDAVNEGKFLKRSNVTANGNEVKITATEADLDQGISEVSYTALTPNSSLDASKIKGVIDISHIPASAQERVVTVANAAARKALTASNVQKGDVVKEADTGLMFFVVDDTKLNQDAGYTQFTAGIASSADKVKTDLAIKLNGGTTEGTNLFTFNGSTAKTVNITPSSIGAAASSHSHNYAGSSSAGGSANSVKTNLAIKLNGGTTEGTNLFTFNGSTAKTVNITPSSIGAAASSHSHNYAGSSSAGGSANSVKTNLAIKLNGGTKEGTNLFTFNGSTAKTVNITPSGIGAAASSHTHGTIGGFTVGSDGSLSSDVGSSYTYPSISMSASYCTSTLCYASLRISQAAGNGDTIATNTISDDGIQTINFNSGGAFNIDAYTTTSTSNSKSLLRVSGVSSSKYAITSTGKIYGYIEAACDETIKAGKREVSVLNKLKSLRVQKYHYNDSELAKRENQRIDIENERIDKENEEIAIFNASIEEYNSTHKDKKPLTPYKKKLVHRAIDSSVKGIKCIGVFAEEFNTLFGLNNENKESVQLMDVAGVSLRAIQELAQQVDDLKREVRLYKRILNITDEQIQQERENRQKARDEISVLRDETQSL